MKIIRYFIDFLFPKAPLIRQLEFLESSKLIAILSQTKRYALPPLPHITSLFPYRNPKVHDIIHEIKYSANKILTAKIAPAISKECETITNDQKGVIITFIPVTQNRKEKRGFDQGIIILNELQRYNKNYIYERNILCWNKKVIQQSLTTNKEERLRNMQHALVCTNHELIKNKTVIVIDDVCTTGATLLEARRALLGAGASKVHLLAIAH